MFDNIVANNEVNFNDLEKNLQIRMRLRLLHIKNNARKL